MCYLIAIVIVSTLLSACNEDYAENCTSANNSVQTATPLVPLCMNKKFWTDYDSINYIYAQKKYATRQINTRTNDNNTVYQKEFIVVKKENLIGGKIADCIGKIAGYYAGRWAGGKIGSLISKNKAYVKNGKIIGSIVGGEVGSITASALANIFIPLDEKKGSIGSGYHPINPGTNLDGKTIIGITPSKPETIEDSIGYIHNKIMKILVNNKKKYTQGNNYNYDLIYTDCNNYLKNEGMFNDTVAYDLQYRKDIIDCAINAAKSSFSCYNGQISGKEVLDNGINLFKKKYDISNEDAQDIKEFCTSSISTATGLKPSQAQSYMDDTYKLINSSSLPVEEKCAVASFINFAINTTLYWDQLDSDKRHK